MDNELKKQLLSAKLKKSKVKDIVSEIKEIAPTSTKSPYFSPIRTRNQRKIEYENDKNPNVKSKIKKQIEDDVKNEIKVEDSNNIKSESKTATKSNVEVKTETGTKRKLHTPEHLLVTVNKKDSLSKKEKSKKITEEEPEKWQEILNNIRQMRSEKEAPVDTMGCDKCADETLDEKTKRYHILVALMLSSQTRDQQTFDAMNRLKNHSLTPENIATSKTEHLEKLLYPVSFYNTKAKNLQKTANILIEKYNSDIPNTIEDLICLPGVGPKMAHICMKSAWNIVTGIGVDVHVHRISNRLGWVHNTLTPEQTRLELESWLPSEHWSEVNHLLVGFGQTICTPLRPNCADCKNQNICPSAFKVEKKNKATKKS